MNLISPLSILILGFLLGLKHATDADHVVAVTTIVSKQRTLRHAAMVGVIWGIGHTFMIIVVGIAIILFHISIPENIQLAFEFIVAIALVALGLLNLTGRMQKIVACITPHHAHEHIEKHSAHLVRPLIVGLIHGLAGSAAVALLILSSIADETVAILYLGIFGIGTIVGMMLVTTLLGIPIIAGSKKFTRFDRIAAIVAGIISILYGLYVGYQIILVYPTVSNLH